MKIKINKKIIGIELDLNLYEADLIYNGLKKCISNITIQKNDFTNEEFDDLKSIVKGMENSIDFVEKEKD